MSDPELRTLLSDAVLAADPPLTARLETDPEAHLDLIALTSRARAETDVLVQLAVSRARSAGCTWESIGQVLAMTRQAAQQRFGHNEPISPPGGTSRTMVLTPVTAFSEMRVLARAGKHGWHATSYGALYFVVEKSDVQWEHVRVTVAGAAGGRYETSGWQRVGTWWFPWVYYKRPTDQPAEPEPADGDYLSI